jgi:hypothetical protein
MKKFLALSIFSIVSPPAQAAILCPMMCSPALMCGPPLLYYGQFFQQCSEITITAAQELACMRGYVAFDPPPPIAAAQVRVFFKRGWSLIAAERRGLISNAEARTQLARNMVDTQYAVEAKVQQLSYRCHYTRCNCFGCSTFCNGY